MDHFTVHILVGIQIAMGIDGNLSVLEQSTIPIRVDHCNETVLQGLRQGQHGKNNTCHMSRRHHCALLFGPEA